MARIAGWDVRETVSALMILRSAMSKPGRMTQAQMARSQFVGCFLAGAGRAGGHPGAGFESRKALALLCYLATHDHPVSRSHLADLFWPDKPEDRAHGNLRRVLHNLHTRLPGCLHTDRHTVHLAWDDTIWLDIATFDELPLPGTRRPAPDPGSR